MAYNTYDLVIVGAGLVGTSLAAALAPQGLRIALLETHLPEQLTAKSAHDSRPLTLNYASKKILDALGIWDNLAPQACPINTINVSEKGRFGKLYFTAQDYSLPALGYVVPFALLRQQLYQAATAPSTVDVITIDRLLAIEPLEPQGTSLEFTTSKGKQTIHTELAIGADGSQSTTRQLRHISTKQQEGDQAFITTLTLSQPHQHRAYERFHGQHIFATLPLPSDHQVRLVWTMPQQRWQQLRQEPPQQIHDITNDCLGGYLGPIQIGSKQQSFPLQMIIANTQIQPGFMLLGNAAHTLYPIAAQGFNLGLADVAALTEVLIQAHQQQQPLGSLTTLQQYLDWRLPQQRWMTKATGIISQLFGLQLPLAGPLRSLGLLAADICPPIKQHLGQHMLGLSGRLPQLMRANH